MNQNAKVDDGINSLLSSMGKPAPAPFIEFSEEETTHKEPCTLVMVQKRIHTLMKRKKLTELDIQLLDVLLKNQ